MQLANTKTVRKIVNSILGHSAAYTDRGANGTRLLAWQCGSIDTATVKNIQDIFTLAGFTNRIKVTTSEYNSLARSGGWTYLRINASFKE